MNILLINGSPKRKESASARLLEGMIPLFHSNVTKTLSLFAGSVLSEREWDAVMQADVLVFFFPLYVDGIPSHLLYHMHTVQQMAAERDMCTLSVYAVVNCGFFEGEQTRYALQMVENWCIRCGFSWKDGLGIGGGGMLTAVSNLSSHHGPLGPVFDGLYALSDTIREQEYFKNQFLSPAFPRLFYKLAAQSRWRSAIRKNGLSSRALSRRM